MIKKISLRICRINYRIKCHFSNFVDFFTAILWTVLWLPGAIGVSFKESYYPESKRKRTVRRIWDNVLYDLRYHRGNQFYNLYGEDIVGNRGGYIDENSFWKDISKINYRSVICSQNSLLRDKFLFYKFMSSFDLPVPKVFGVIKRGHFYNDSLEEVTFDYFRNYSDYFIKDVDGECASFVKRIHRIEELKVIVDQHPNASYILQESVKQSREMNSLNECAVNTLRIITVLKDGKATVLSQVLRVGSSLTGGVDNWAAGGLAIGINENGYLKKYGLYKPGHGTKAIKHPDTNVIFETFKVPDLDKARDLACKAHLYFYNLGAIGWDIAITDDGPVFIEGNDDFEITLMQACDRPLKATWKSLI